MLRRKTVVLYVHHLFGEGIARLLETGNGVRVTRIDARRPDAHDQLKQLHPDVVIAEGNGTDPEILELFREAPEALVICVELDDNAADIYRAWHLAAVTPEDLKDVVRGRGPHRPRHASSTHRGHRTV